MPTPQLSIRVAEITDASALAHLARALLAHERKFYAASDLHPWAASEAELRKQLRQPDTRFFVAEQGERMMGYVKVVMHGVSFDRVEIGRRQWWKNFLSETARRTFNVLLRRPRANTSPQGAYIAGAFVLPEYRRSQVGRALVQFTEDWLRQRGLATSELHVLYANEAAREFWQSLGYEPLTLGLRKSLTKVE
jgi:ribosomal protein S18 acetylase RimI-like enzyme